MLLSMKPTITKNVLRGTGTPIGALQSAINRVSKTIELHDLSLPEQPEGIAFQVNYIDYELEPCATIQEHLLPQWVEEHNCYQSPFIRVPVIRIFGTTRQGYSIYARIHKFSPYFFVGLPTTIPIPTTEDLITWKDKIDTLIYKKMIEIKRIQEERKSKSPTLPNKRYYNQYTKRAPPSKKIKLQRVPYVVGIELQKNTPIRGFSDTKFFSLKIIVAIPQYVEKARDLFEESHTLYTGCPPLQVYDAALTFDMRYMTDTMINGCSWVHVAPTIDYTIGEGYKLKDTVVAPTNYQTQTHTLYGFTLDITTDYCAPIPASLETDIHAPLRIVSHDSEWLGQKGNFPVKGIDPMTTICFVCKTYNNPSDPTCDGIRIAMQIGSITAIGDALCISFENEVELLIAFRDIIIAFDPDIITGYNVNNFDVPYYIDRAKELGIEAIANDWSKALGKPIDYTEEKTTSNAQGTRVTAIIKTIGRTTYDVMTVIQKEKKLPSYKLNFVAQKYVGDTKRDVDSRLGDSFQLTEEKRTEFADYCLQDADLPLRIAEKLMIWPNAVEMARATGVSLRALIYRGQQIRVICQLYKAKQSMGYLVDYKKSERVFEQKEKTPTRNGDQQNKKPIVQQKPVLQPKPLLSGQQLLGTDGIITTKCDTQQQQQQKKAGKSIGYKGATVLTALVGFYETPLATLDFASLYPSIMIAHNLCYTTIMTQQQQAEARSNNYNISPTGVVFANAPHYFQPTMCVYLVEHGLREDVHFRRSPHDRIYLVTPLCLPYTMMEHLGYREDDDYTYCTLQSNNGLWDHTSCQSCAYAYEQRQSHATYKHLLSKEQQVCSFDAIWYPFDIAVTPVAAQTNVHLTTTRRLGLLPQMLMRLLAARKVAKTLLAREVDPSKKAVYDGRQLALKISANSIYGFTGVQAGTLPEPRIASSVTAYGRQMIEYTQQIVHEQSADATVVYGDTDSVVIHYGIYPSDDDTLFPFITSFMTALGQELGEMSIDTHHIEKQTLNQQTRYTNDEFYQRVAHDDPVGIDYHHVIQSLQNDFIVYYKKQEHQKVETVHNATNKDQLDKEPCKDETKSTATVFSTLAKGQQILQATQKMKQMSQLSGECMAKRASSNVYIRSFVEYLFEQCPFSLYVRLVTRALNPKTTLFEQIRTALDCHLVEQVAVLAVESCSLVNKGFKDPINLAFEKVMVRLLLLSKKRYAYLQSVGMPSFMSTKWTVELKGLETARRDNCLYLRDSTATNLDMLLGGKDLYDIIMYARRCIVKLYNSDVPIEQLIITMGYNKHLEDYKNKARFAHIIERKMKEESATIPHLGDRIPFVAISGLHKDRISDCIEDPDYVLKYNLPIDYRYYITNQLMRPYRRIFRALLLRPDNLFIPHSCTIETIMGIPEITQHIPDDLCIRFKKQIAPVYRNALSTFFTTHYESCEKCHTALTLPIPPHKTSVPYWCHSCITQHGNVEYIDICAKAAQECLQRIQESCKKLDACLTCLNPGELVPIEDYHVLPTIGCVNTVCPHYYTMKTIPTTIQTIDHTLQRVCGDVSQHILLVPEQLPPIQKPKVVQQPDKQQRLSFSTNGLTTSLQYTKTQKRTTVKHKKQSRVPSQKKGLPQQNTLSFFKIKKT